MILVDNDTPDRSGEAARTLGHSDQPLEVSVVMPLRNEAQSLPYVIAGLQQQSYAPAEVILVDGGSTDDTVALARQLTQDDNRFRIVEAGDATPGRGRNVGTAAARYNWIAYADGGNRLEPTWLEYLVREVESNSAVDVVYGNYEPITETTFERAYASIYVAPKQDRPGGRMRGPFISSSLLRREVWQKVAGFPDWRAAEDLAFIERVEAANFETKWAPQATVWWQLPPTLPAMFSKLVLYSRHNVWAGRQSGWHYGLARSYALYLPLLPLILWVARLGRSLWKRRESHSIWWLLNPARLMLTAAIMLAMDLATFVGWIQATLLRKWYQNPKVGSATKPE
jgi:cellulose synthase/poly-beta-1,6-N-acetylglucosamine synthase-like glycosyltransferase